MDTRCSLELVNSTKMRVSAGGRDEHPTEARRHASGEVRKESANRRQKSQKTEDGTLAASGEANLPRQ